MIYKFHLKNKLKIKNFLDKILSELKNKFYSLIIIFLNNSSYVKIKNKTIKITQENSNLLNKEVVDVIVPVFNSQYYVEKFLESIL